jgi:hypothetical protein
VNEIPFSSELDNIVEECLDAILRGETTLADCLRRYPEHTAELKPLLQIGLLTARLKSPTMSAASIQALDQRLRAQMQNGKSPHTQSKIIMWQAFVRIAAALLIVALLVFGSSAGLVSASSATLPGDTLYPVKRAWESARVAAASVVGQQDDVWLDIAQTRWDEVTRLDEQGRLNETAFVDLYSATAQAIRTADPVTMPEVIVYTQEVHQTMDNIAPQVITLPIYNDVWVMTTLKSDGTLSIPSETPPSQSAPIVSTPESTPTLELPVEVTVEVTDEATEEVTVEVTEEATDEVVLGTSTPRFPPTATRTPTPTPTVTYTPSPPLPTSTPSLTPPPIVGLTVIAPVTLPPNVTATPVPETPILPTGNATARIRDTQQAVYMTQTAIATQLTPVP